MLRFSIARGPCHALPSRFLGSGAATATALGGGVRSARVVDADVVVDTDVSHRRRMSTTNAERRGPDETMPSRSSRRVYVLGMGNVGRLFAHALATLPDNGDGDGDGAGDGKIPITLLFHRGEVWREWVAMGADKRGIEIWSQRESVNGTGSNESDGPGGEGKVVSSRSAGFDVELVSPQTGAGSSFTSDEIRRSRAEEEKEDGQLEDKDTIHTLIITTKATQTVSALRPIAHRIHPSATVLFAQNGMGVVEKVIGALGPDYEVFRSKRGEGRGRPRFMSAIVSHGLYPKGRFSSVHIGKGAVALGEIKASTPLLSATSSGTDGNSLHTTTTCPSTNLQSRFGTNNDSEHYSGNDSSTNDKSTSIPNSDYLLDLLLSSPILNATFPPPIAFQTTTLLKLVANSTINPLTALFNLRNGELFTSPSAPSILPLLDHLLIEISNVLIAHVRAHSNPSSDNDNDNGIADRSDSQSNTTSSSPSSAQTRQADTTNPFTKPSLLAAVKSIAERTAGNESSMLQDFKRGRETEIDFLNGWVVEQGRGSGIDVGVNERVAESIKRGKGLGVDEAAKLFFR